MIRPNRLGRVALMLSVVALTASTAAFGQGQDGNDQLSKILEDKDKLEEAKKEKLRPPIEFFRSQILPNDVLPYIKANHWSMVGLEMRANHEDYDGSLQTRPIPLLDQPHEMIYRRDARLIKGQRVRLTMPIFLPSIPKEMGFQLVRPEAIRQDEDWPAPLRVLEPHQQLVVVLSKSTDQFARWSQSRSTLPVSGRKDDPALLDKQRYYRLVLPLEPDKPLLASHPLTWSTVSHVIWDGLAPEAVGTAQQQAMIDWLHFGGQLVIVGGAGPAFAPLRESFLAPYLPAEPSGENVMRMGTELQALSEAYRPSVAVYDPEEPMPLNFDPNEVWERLGKRYKNPSPIPTAEKKPMFITGLAPKAGASVIPIGGEGNPPLGVEWKVGRGRVLMLAVSLSDPDLIAWPGYDTMVRRVVLRRPEEKQLNGLTRDSIGQLVPPRYESLSGPDLTTVRYLARDLGAPDRQKLDDEANSVTYTPPPPTITSTLAPGATTRVAPRGGMVTTMLTSAPPPEPTMIREIPVGEWIDSSALPTMSRDVLEKASGIEIPGRAFVLKVILAYILVLVPLNYLICRYVLGRREWAWVVVPTLSLAFAIGVERAAAYDVGYDSSCDEIDLIETHGDYPRGHISRFASLYSTGRVKFTISYPSDPTALALPLATGRALRGEDTTLSSFETQPIPALVGFQVQPRSLAMFRAEQMASLPGTVTITPPGDGPRSLVNESGLDLKDAWVVRLGPDDKTFEGVAIGAIASGARAAIGAMDTTRPPVSSGLGQLEPGLFLDLLLKRAFAQKPEDVGELRLIAWADKPLAGQAIEPAVDRRRGFTLVVAHLEASPLLDPASSRYNALAGQVADPIMPATFSNPPNLPMPGPRARSRFTMQPQPPPLTPPTGPVPADADPNVPAQPPTTPPQTGPPTNGPTAPEIPRP